MSGRSGPRGAPLTSSRLLQLLEAHNSALAGCRRCGHDTAVLPIISTARAPRVMLVGQAPGQSEVSDRRAFAGRAGKTLFRWLERAGVDEATAREQIHIAAITRCYPGPSPTGRGDRVPSQRERALCSEWLDAELRIIQPRLLIPVGRLAIERFLGPRPLVAVVGRVHTVTYPRGAAQVIPLPHPSGASSWIHEANHSTLLDRALCLLRAALDQAGVPVSPERRAASAKRRSA
jgi:uracil-DNA glycosylase